MKIKLVIYADKERLVYLTKIYVMKPIIVFIRIY